MLKPAYKKKEFIEERPDKIINLAKDLTPILNQLHNKSYPMEYWLLIAGDYFKACVNREPLFKQKNYKENPWLFSLNSFTKPKKKELIASHLKYFYNSVIKETNISRIINNIYDKENILLGSRALELKKNIDGYVIKSTYSIKFLFSYPQRVKRKVLAKYASEFEDNFYKNVILSLPMIYVEYFEQIDRQILIKNASDKIFHVEHYMGFFQKYLAAKYRAYGSKLVAYQTGGFMGEIKNHPNKVDYLCIDELRTFGWKQNGKDVPDKPYRLIDYKERWDKHRNEIGASYKKKILVVYTQKRMDMYREHFLNFAINFLNKIPSNSCKRYTVRPFPKSRKISNRKEAIKLKVPSCFRIDDGTRDISKSAAEAELLVLTNLPSTTFLESIYTDQPVVAINTNSRPSDIFSSFIPTLINLGVIHENVESLTKFITNTQNYSEWWGKVNSNKKFKKFANKFAGKSE